ncbi:helix-turn-helix domain-containing protein [Pseudonocardia sp. WMMC193]|uniref:helix-turn-helix domain-containing protein n=1 Tax=Pseudonocardia sp. WMMC193 TaxID=2911965 RepID=UPI001F3E3E6A|nr:helix-turn-helix domain-containing protein [Pseudonocardia sp. WMMC193]MCF7550786.1 hypothetical protein [Pseudonocardia sp. WMMC193]
MTLVALKETPIQEITPSGVRTCQRPSRGPRLHRTDGNRTRAAAALGIGRTTLYRKMKEYRIPATG